MAGDRDKSPVPYIALHIPSQITRRTPLRGRMATMEQAANPTNTKTAPNKMSASWPRSIPRSWSSNRPPPIHRQDTRLDVDVDARPLDLETGHFGKKPTIPSRSRANRE